tara:strand:+ start:1626 stop:2771 length:1146 start_codon:yes stop_codon:yes gene_type:complete
MILFINKRFNNRNGAEKSGIDVVNSMLKANASLALLYIDYYNNFNDINDINQLKIIKAPKFKTSIEKKSLKEIFDYLESKIFDKNRIKKIISLNINFIIANSLSAEFYAKKISEKLNVKCCLIVRESPDFYKNPIKTVKRINFFNQLVFVSSIVMEQWISIKPELKLKSIYIPNTINEKYIDKIIVKPKLFYKNKLNFNPDNINIVIVGKFLTRKNQSLILDNLNQFYNLNKKIKFHFIGKHLNSYGEKIKKKLKKNTYKNIVHLYGFKKNALEYIYASDYLILTALAEASPRVIYEAMLLKTLVIASNVGGTAELIKNNKTGYLYENNNIEELLLKLSNSLDTKNNKTIVQDANQLYYNSFSNQIHQKNYKKLLELISQL